MTEPTFYGIDISILCIACTVLVLIFVIAIRDRIEFLNIRKEHLAIRKRSREATSVGEVDACLRDLDTLMVRSDKLMKRCVG